MKDFELYYCKDEDLYLSIDHKAQIYCRLAADPFGYVPLYAKLQYEEGGEYSIVYKDGEQISQYFNNVSFVAIDTLSPEQLEQRKEALKYISKIHGQLQKGEGILVYKKHSTGKISVLFSMINAELLSDGKEPCQSIYSCESKDMIDKFLNMVQKYYGNCESFIK